MSQQAVSVPQASAFRPDWARARKMMLAWLAVGAAVGIGTAGHSGNAIAIISGLLAGVIVMLPVGVLLALLGGAAKETLIGALLGAVMGAAIGALNDHTQMMAAANVGLLGGAWVGATFVGMYRRFKQARAMLGKLF